MAAERFVVTGASGFVGGAITQALLAQGHSVVIPGRRAPDHLIAAGAQFIPLHLEQLTSSNELAAIVKGAAGIFHVAAKVQMWGDEQEFVATNVRATEYLLQSCRAHGVGRFVFTSSPSVIAAGTDLLGVDERCPYPTHFEAAYPRTKALAEQMVLAAHSDNLHTLALRPHLIFGPGDTNLVPTILNRARAGRLVRIGSGNNLSDFTYIDDCVQAHMRAMEALRDSTVAGGRAYFISQGDPYPLWRFIDEVVRIGGLAPVTKRIPTWAALGVAQLAEVWSAVSHTEPFLSKFLVREMTTSHYFNIHQARELLGYRPSMSVQEGLARLEVKGN